MKNMDSSPARSYSSTEQLLPNDLISTNNRNRVVPTIRDVLLTLGNWMVTGGNYLLYQDGVLSLAPALFFMLEGGINSKISLTNLILRYWNINNVRINNLLTGVSFATAPLLPLAVAWLNWPTPNPDTLPVTYAFITAAAASSLNHIVTISKKISECCAPNNEENAINQQRNIWQKIGNTAASLLAPITIASAITGVSLFAYHELSNPNNNDDDQPFYKKRSTAFWDTIAGLAIVGTGLLVNTGMELYENWCADVNDFDEEDNYENISSSTSSPSSSSSEDSDDNNPLLNKPFNPEKINNGEETQSVMSTSHVVEIADPKPLNTAALNSEERLPVKQQSSERRLSV
ncbi:hypothetical protein [Spiroplasma endosymbiont of Nomada ruficornis]|uniref:hypothetical protein n=3 Tax=Spiroplasma TaxID=2132 RepID=UPI00313E98E8